MATALELLSTTLADLYVDRTIVHTNGKSRLHVSYIFFVDQDNDYGPGIVEFHGISLPSGKATKWTRSIDEPLPKILPPDPVSPAPSHPPC